MARFTEIKKINGNNIVANYRVFENGINPETFFIHINTTKKTISCSLNADASDPFYTLDLSDPNYQSIPLSQNTVRQHVFVRGICKIMQAYERGDLPNELSICN